MFYYPKISIYYRSEIVKESINKIEETNSKYEKTIQFPSNHFYVPKGKLIQFVKKFSNKEEDIVYGFGFALEESEINDPNLLICPLDAVLIKDRNLIKDNIYMTEIGILPLISNKYVFLSKTQEIRMIDKKRIIRNSKFFSNTLGAIPYYKVNEVSIKYLYLMGQKLNVGKYELNKPFFC